MRSKLFSIVVLLLAISLSAMAQKRDTTHVVTAAMRDNAQIAELFGVPAADLFAFNADKAESFATVKRLSEVKYPVGAVLTIPRSPRSWRVRPISDQLPEWPITYYYDKGLGGYISISRSLRIEFVSNNDARGGLYIAYSGDSHGTYGAEDGGETNVEFWSAIFWAGDRDELPRYIREMM